MDHNDTADDGHDVYYEGLHVDVSRREGETVHLQLRHAPLSPADVGALMQAGYGDALPIELSTLDTATAESDTPATAAATDEDDGTEDEPENEPENDRSPLDRGMPSDGSVMSASPDQLLASSDTDAATSQCRLTDTAPEGMTTPAAPPEPTEDVDAGEGDPGATTEATPSDVGAQASQ
jgi:hypothetical protein